MEKIDIKSMTLQEIQREFQAAGLPGYRAGQVYRWLHRGVKSFSQMSDLGKGLREQLTEELRTRGPEALYAELTSVDPEAAASIHPNNHVRVLRALEHYRGLKAEAAVRSWLFQIVFHEAMRHIGKNRMEFPGETEALPEGVYQEKAFEESGQEVYEAVMRLPEAFRIIVVLRYYEEFSLKEIAGITGLNLSTVKSRLYAAHRKLGAELKEAEE